MPKYLLAYHGGAMPETEEEGAKVMAAWQAWMGGLGEALLDPGNATGMAKTVTSSGVTEGGGANPVSGYSLLNAADIDAAAAMAKDCPILDGGGTVEVAETLEM
jgi:hypothetical protein